MVRSMVHAVLFELGPIMGFPPLMASLPPPPAPSPTAAPLPPAPLPLILACVCLAAAHGISARRTAVLVCSGLVRVGGPAAVLRIVLPAVVSGSIAARI